MPHLTNCSSLSPDIRVSLVLSGLADAADFELCSCLARVVRRPLHVDPGHRISQATSRAVEFAAAIAALLSGSILRPHVAALTPQPLLRLAQEPSDAARADVHFWTDQVSKVHLA